jgi:hypothetical protein
MPTQLRVTVDTATHIFPGQELRVAVRFDAYASLVLSRATLAVCGYVWGTRVSKRS